MGGGGRCRERVRVWKAHKWNFHPKSFVVMGGVEAHKKTLQELSIVGGHYEKAFKMDE